MGFSAPTYDPIDPTKLAGNQYAQQAKIPVNAQAINQKLQQLPSYQQYQTALKTTGPDSATARTLAQTLLQQAQAEGVTVPDGLVFDPYTGQVRTANWSEQHPVLTNLIGIGATSGAGLGVGAAAAALGGGAAASSLPAVAGGGSATTAATVPPALAATGGGVASTAGSWLTGPTASLLGTAANVFGQIYGTNQQANANAQAAQIQAQEFDKALAQQESELQYQHGQDTNTQNQYAAYLSRLSPYAQTGQAANNSLARYTGLPQAAQTPLSPTLNQPPANPYTPIAGSQPQQQQSAQQSSANSFVPSAVANSPTASQVPQAAGPYANWPILQAPDGSKRRVSPDKVQQALAAGATMVNT